jgi:zinc transport system substrate-binding protein
MASVQSSFQQSRRFSFGLHGLAAALLAGMLTLLAPMLAAAPVVAVTIKPLQLIAAAVTAGISVPVLALAPGQDPHHISLRPSERRTLAEADLVLWTGPMLEQPLEGVMDSIDATVLTVQQFEGLVLLQVDDHADPHVWLDTRNARFIAAMLAQTLATLDIPNAARYGTNLQQFTAALEELDAEITNRFAGLDTRQWAVYHHAFRYIEQQFALQPPLTLADSENNPPGIRSVLALQQQLQQGNISCLLTEPGVNHEELRSMLAPAQPTVIDADVMGVNLTADAGSYVVLMHNLALRVADCLRSTP